MSFLPGEGGLQGMGVIQQPDEFRAAPGRAGAQSPSLEPAGALWPPPSPGTAGQRFASIWGMHPERPCRPWTPTLLQADIMAKAPGWAESPPHKCWGGAGRSHPASPFQPWSGFVPFQANTRRSRTNTASSPGASPENTRKYQWGGETPDCSPLMSLGTSSHPPSPS